MSYSISNLKRYFGAPPCRATALSVAGRLVSFKLEMELRRIPSRDFYLHAHLGQHINQHFHGEQFDLATHQIGNAWLE